MALPVAGKILPDTNVFVDYLRDGAHAGWVVGSVVGTVRFLSAVVLLELRLGADTPGRRRAVDRIEKAFPPSRVVAPSAELFGCAGRLFLAMFGKGGAPADRLGAVNDLLIALTAWRLGATVVTQNLADFRRIRQRLSGLAVAAP